MDQPDQCITFRQLRVCKCQKKKLLGTWSKKKNNKNVQISKLATPICS